MKKNDFINNIKDKSSFIMMFISICFICFIILLIVGLIHNFLGMSLFSQLISAIILLILFITSSKIIFDVNYSDLFQEIKFSKYDCIDKLLVTMFFSSVNGFICILIYQIDFIINPDKTKLVSYFIKSLNYDNTYINNNLDILMFIIIFTIGVAAEEIFFRYTLYKVFVKKKDDIIIFIILSSIIFGLYHFTNIPRFFTTVTMSFFISIIYIMTKSVVYTFISHLLWNFSVSISTYFIYFFKSINISMSVFNCGISEIIAIFLLILLSIYSYYKRGYILVNIKNKIYNKKDEDNIY